MYPEYNFLLLAISISVAGSAVAGIFTLNAYLASISETLLIKNRKLMLGIFSIIAGTALWLNHLLITFATLHEYKPTSTPGVLAVGWFFCIGSCLVFLDITSRKQLPLKRFSIGSALTGLLAFGMFCSDWRAALDFSQFGFKRAELLLAYFVSVLVIAGNLLIFFWIKSYKGNYNLPIKLALAIISAISIITVHIAYNQAFYAIAFTNNSESFLHNRVVGVTITLGLICLFSIVFTIVLLYEKYQARLNNQPTSNSAVDLAETIDSLTGLPNRNAFEMHLQNAVIQSQTSDKTIAVAFIDLDHFKPVNDQFGHHVGDVLLSLVAQRLNTAVRGFDYVARIGGDEFVVLFENVSDEDDVAPVAQRIVSALKEPFNVNGHHLSISCSVGIAMYQHDGDATGLMIRADTAMYKAKEAGKNQFKFFDAEIERASNQMRDMQSDLEVAIRENQLRLLFQPKVNCRTFSPEGAEAYICWQHPMQGLLMPEQFLPAAERFGLINQINHWALEECCKVLAEATQKQLQLRLSMNLSALQLRRADLFDDITETFNKYQVRTNQMIFEIKDITSVQNRAQLHKQLEQFRQAHIKISLDDFGSQSFSLDSLQNLNVDEVKLDKSFINQIEYDKTARSLVDAVIRLSHALSLNVVACGVENDVQSNLLKEMNCDQIQGYLLSRPVTEENLLNMFRQLRSKFELTGQFRPSDYRSEAA